jgi:hypothetical protein
VLWHALPCSALSCCVVPCCAVLCPDVLALNNVKLSVLYCIVLYLLNCSATARTAITGQCYDTALYACLFVLAVSLFCTMQQQFYVAPFSRFHGLCHHQCDVLYSSLFSASYSRARITALCSRTEHHSAALLRCTRHRSNTCGSCAQAFPTAPSGQYSKS